MNNPNNTFSQNFFGTNKTSLFGRDLVNNKANEIANSNTLNSNTLNSNTLNSNTLNSNSNTNNMALGQGMQQPQNNMLTPTLNSDQPEANNNLNYTDYDVFKQGTSFSDINSNNAYNKYNTFSGKYVANKPMNEPDIYSKYDNGE